MSSLRFLPEHYQKLYLKTAGYPAMKRLAEKGPIPLRGLASVPLFSLRTADCIGSGEFPELLAYARWARRSGFSGNLILPTPSRPSGEDSPYSAESLCSIDVTYLRLSEVPEVQRSSAAQAVLKNSSAEIVRLNSLPRVDHDGTRRLKEKVLRALFYELGGGEDLAGGRRGQFESFCRENADWLDEHAAFRVLADKFGGKYFKEWPVEFQGPKNREVISFLARPESQREMRFHKFVQWLCDEQQTKYNLACAELGLPICGDVMFAPGRQSADYYFHQDEFLPDVSVGSLPDIFAEEGQNWGLPMLDPDKFLADPSFGLRHARVMARRGIKMFRNDHGIGRTNACIIPEGESPLKGARVFQGLPGYFIDHCLVFFRGLASLDVEVFSENLGDELPYLQNMMELLGIGEMGVFRWARHDQVGEFVHQLHYPRLGTMCTAIHDVTTTIEHLRGLADPDHACYPGTLKPDYDPKEKNGLRNEAAALCRSFGLSGIPERYQDLYYGIMGRVAHGESFQALFPMGDVLGCHQAYWRQDDWQINRPGIANCDAYRFNWNWVVPDLTEHLGLGTERALFVSDFYRRLMIDSGRFDDKIAA